MMYNNLGNNGYNNFYNYGYGGYNGFNNGYVYPTQPIPEPKFTQPLTEAQIKELMSKAEGFSVKITPEEAMRAMCTHKRGKNITLIDDGNGEYTCTICGTKFRDEQYSEAEVEAVCQSFNNIMNVIKTAWLDVPPDIAKNFYLVTAFANKVPQLYVIASENFNKHTGGVNAMQYANQAPAMQQLNMLVNPYGMGNGIPAFNNPYPGVMSQGAMYNQGMPQNNMMPGYNQQAPSLDPSLGMGMPQNNGGYQPTMSFTQQPMMGNEFGYYGQPTPQMNVMPQQPAPAQQNTVEQPAPAGAPVVNHKAFEA